MEFFEWIFVCSVLRLWGVFKEVSMWCQKWMKLTLVAAQS
jgi:hypothetical protein